MSSSREPGCPGTPAYCKNKEMSGLCVFHLGLSDESVLANVVHVALFLGYLFSTDFLLLAGLVVLHRGCPDVPVLPNEVQESLFALDLFLSNFLSHLNTSKPRLGFDNESYRLII